MGSTSSSAMMMVLVETRHRVNSHDQRRASSHHYTHVLNRGTVGHCPGNRCDQTKGGGIFVQADPLDCRWAVVPSLLVITDRFSGGIRR